MDDNGEMDSLFEGMTLFSPSPITEEVNDSLPHHQPPQQQLQQPQPPPPAEEDEAYQPSTSSDHPPPAPPPDSSPSSSQPLDENLFSDLTLITPSTLDEVPESQSQPDPPPAAKSPPLTTTTPSNRETSTSSSISRQTSTRKKRRAGLRIGYGRDSSVQDEPPLESGSVESELPPSLPIAATTVEAQPPEEESTPNELQSSTANPDSQINDSAISASEDAQSEAEVLSKNQDLHEENEKVNGGAPPIEVESEQIRVQISEKLRHVKELVASVSATRKECTKKRRKAVEALNVASEKYRELEKELEEACEAEDFETAERVSESLALAEKVKEEMAVGLRQAEAECDAVESRMLEVLECQIAAEEECAALLKDLAENSANAADVVLENAEVESGKELAEWVLLNEDLELKKIELDLESIVITEARSVLSDSIECSVDDDRREMQLLHERKELLTKELENLLALVKEKEAEIATTDQNIEVVEKRIGDVVSSFHRMQSSTDKEYDNLQSRLSRLQQENETLTSKKKEIDDFLSQETCRGTELQKLSQNSAEEANVYQETLELRKTLMLFTSKSREEKVRLAKMEEQYLEDVNKLRQEISAARASLQELSTTKSSFQQEIESLKQRLVFIEKRAPELEAEKKVAAAARNFKEAARIASEMKSLNAEKQDLQIKVEQTVHELEKLEKEISDTVIRLEETEGQISAKEKTAALSRYQRLLLTAGAAKAERSAALDLGDLEEAGILLAEAEAAETEAEKLQPLHNFNEDELVSLPNQYISVQLVSNLGGKMLAELAASVCTST